MAEGMVNVNIYGGKHINVLELHQFPHCMHNLSAKRSHATKHHNATTTTTTTHLFVRNRITKKLHVTRKITD
jgi:hypothetical protein